MRIDFKNNRGFTTVDTGVAMIIFVIFAVIMTSISYSVYQSSIEAKRTAVALNYGVDIFENIGQLDYSEVTASSDKIFDIDALSTFEEEDASIDGVEGIETITGKIGTYNIELKIEDYNGENLIKIITLKITYPISKSNTEKVELQRLKVNR